MVGFHSNYESLKFQLNNPQLLFEKYRADHAYRKKNGIYGTYRRKTGFFTNRKKNGIYIPEENRFFTYLDQLSRAGSPSH
jgi:hypothetical protein